MHVVPLVACYDLTVVDLSESNKEKVIVCASRKNKVAKKNIY